MSPRSDTAPRVLAYARDVLGRDGGLRGDIAILAQAVVDLAADKERLVEALEALVFYAPDGGSIDYAVSDFAIAILHGKTVEEATHSGRHLEQDS